MQAIDPKRKSLVASEEIFRWVKTGRFSPGDRLPSERAMAKELGMNHLTVRRGLAELVSKGIVEKRPNVGNFVASRTVSETAIVLPKFVVQGSSPHPFFSQIVAGVQATLDQKTSAMLILSYRPGHLWEDVGPALTARQIGGVVLAPGADVTIEDVQRIRQAGIQVVLIKPSLPLAPLRLMSVEVDVSGATAEVFDGILARGHRRIVIAQYASDPLLVSYRRLIDTIVQRWGSDEVQIKYIEISNTETTIDFSPLRRVFDDGPMPSVVMLYDEFMASAMFRYCYERDVRVPDDLSVASVLDSAPTLHPVPLAAADSATAGRQQGRLAAEYLLRLMASERPAERRVYVGCDVHWHASLATITEPTRDGSAAPVPTTTATEPATAAAQSAAELAR